MKKLLPLLLALCLTLSACAAPAAVPLPGDSVTAVTVTYAGKTVMPEAAIHQNAGTILPQHNIGTTL